MCCYLNVHFQGQRINVAGNNTTCKGLHVNCPILIQSEFPQRIFMKVLNNKLHVYIVSRADTFGQTNGLISLHSKTASVPT